MNELFCRIFYRDSHSYMAVLGSLLYLIPPVAVLVAIMVLALIRPDQVGNIIFLIRFVWLFFVTVLSFAIGRNFFNWSSSGEIVEVIFRSFLVGIIWFLSIFISLVMILIAFRMTDRGASLLFFMSGVKACLLWFFVEQKIYVMCIAQIVLSISFSMLAFSARKMLTERLVD